MSRASATREVHLPPHAAILPALTDIQVEALGRETGEPGWMVDARRSALDQYRRMGPSSRADAVFRGDATVFPFADLNLEALALSGKAKRAPAAWLKPAAGRATGGQLVLEDRARQAFMLDEKAAQAGVLLMPLSQAAKEHPDLVRGLLGSIVPASDGVFAALASILYDVGLLLHVPKGVRLERPLHTLVWSSGAGLRAWRLLVNVEEGAEASLVHECASPERPESAARVDIVELIVHRGAVLRFFMTQAWGPNIVRVGHERAVVHQDGRLEWGFAQVGAHSTATYSALELTEPGAAARLSGLQILDGGQHSEYSTLQYHHAPNTVSDFLCKTVLAGSSHSYSRGMVRVAPGAAGMDGYQGNRILMLSGKAKAEAIPGLEILSDDVRCSHGVTIGELDPDELFYLRSRGIAETEARRMLIGGFLEDVLARIPEQSIRERVHLAMEAKMKKMEVTDVPRAEAAGKDPEPDRQGA
jgi:Fe-S cluster assembly protein SufD